jgi:hypothetical protein
MNRRCFEVALEQVSQVVYEVWAESSEEAEEIATQMAMTSIAPQKLLCADVTCCCADEISRETEWRRSDRAA